MNQFLLNVSLTLMCSWGIRVDGLDEHLSLVVLRVGQGVDQGLQGGWGELQTLGGGQCCYIVDLVFFIVIKTNNVRNKKFEY